MKSPRPAVWLLFPALLLFCFPALAQPPASLLDQLDDPDYAVRRDATEALLLDDTLTPEQVAGWAADATTLEQRHRLRLVARHHLLRRLRIERFGGEGPGSIGIVQSVQTAPPPPPHPEGVPDAPRQAPPEDFPEGGPHAGPGADHPPLSRHGSTFALVTRVLPGFPASGRLRPLDRIVGLDGQPLDGPANAPRFEDLMRRYRANQTLTLTVQRDLQTLDIDIPLANGQALPAMYGLPEFDLTADFDRAWTQFLQTHPALRDEADAIDSDRALPNP